MALDNDLQCTRSACRQAEDDIPAAQRHTKDRIAQLDDLAQRIARLQVRPESQRGNCRGFPRHPGLTRVVLLVVVLVT